MSEIMDKAAFIMGEGRRFARMANRPLTKQHTSDAWNERQNRISSSRIAVDLLMKSVMMGNKLKAENENK